MNSNTNPVCLDSHRRVEIRANGSNGIDYVDIDDLRAITVNLLRAVPEDLMMQNVIVEGPAGSLPIKVTDLHLCSVDDPDEVDCFRITLDRPGGLSPYTLRLVELSSTGDPTGEPLHGFDPRYSTIDFNFHAANPSGMDCAQSNLCSSSVPAEIDINYLAKDFSTFRQLVLDRLALIMPGWTEQHIPDLGIALVEILAYVADYLSYTQDAVATEAYLATARKRISVRRHVRLLDYRMHEGCNARTWIQIQTSQNVTDFATTPDSLWFISGFEGRANLGTILKPADLATAADNPYLVFEAVTTQPVSLQQSVNRILFYNWGDRECCLPQGATSATFEDPWIPAKAAAAEQAPEQERQRSLGLQTGDYLLLEEALGPQTGVAADADPTHRWVGRLTQVVAAVDPLNNLPILEVQWAKADALPFDLCLSTIGPAPHCELIKHVSVARGNLLLADQGTWIRDEELGAVPVVIMAQTCIAEHHSSDLALEAGNFAPSLKQAGLTYRVPPNLQASASLAAVQYPRAAVPQIQLFSIAPLEDGSGPIFSPGELQNPALLAARLTAPSLTAASQLLLSRLPKATVQLLQTFDPTKAIQLALATALAAEMAQFVRTWTPQVDLLNSASSARDFVVEMDDDRIAHLRFGDGMLGLAPEAGESFVASYRIASGGSGNVGRETINHIVLVDEQISGLTLTLTNPLEAQGGTDPEPVDEVKLFAPSAFLNQLDRAITADDYAQLAEANPLVQRAAATLVWTGNRYEARIAIDPLGTDNADPGLLREIEEYLYPFRRIGHDLRVVQAQYVPLDLALSIEVSQGYLAAHVQRALLDAFSNRKLASGQTGFFYPDNFTFGQSIYASQIVATAQSLDGVESVSITRLEPLLEEEHNDLIDGVLSIGALEVAQVDNDPTHPERGRLTLEMRGGR
jgi:hypothetical protein